MATKAQASSPVTQRGEAQRIDAARTSAKRTEISGGPAIPKPSGTYVADNFTGDITATMGGTFALAHDGELAGLARVTMAMREPVRKESPAPRRLVGLASWAAVLGILGAILAIRSGVGILVGAPSWFFPTETAIGIIGVCLTMASFLTARERVVPWFLLGLASCALLGAFVTTLVAF
ncbi:MAG TPA: hypothetical protein VGJ28_25315 [Micromonosporaceae bacterium]